VFLQAVYDPGFGIVVVGGVLLLLGMLVSFYFPRCCVYVRAEPEEGIRIAGRGSRYAADFEREFRELVDELKVALVSAGGEEA
jgi:cytochrome c biogenesis protein ResB